MATAAYYFIPCPRSYRTIAAEGLVRASPSELEASRYLMQFVLVANMCARIRRMNEGARAAQAGSKRQNSDP